VFIWVNAHKCMNICICAVFLKKKLTRGEGALARAPWGAAKRSVRRSVDG
jgi:hypothetical protein